MILQKIPIKIIELSCTFCRRNVKSTNKTGAIKNRFSLFEYGTPLKNAKKQYDIF